MERNAVFITGAARRVGAYVAMHFAKAGYDIVLHYHNSQAAAQRMKEDIESYGVTCTLVNHDMQDIPGIDALLRSVHQIAPHCSVLINNASVFDRGTFMETTEALFDQQMHVNFKAPFFTTQAFAKYFKKGCVINMLDTSISETQGSHFAYLLSKKVLADFTKMAARELGPHITCHGICPGILLPSNELDQEYIEKLQPTLPMHEIGELDDIADTALWLSQSPTTGQCIFIDGGQHVL